MARGFRVVFAWQQVALPAIHLLFFAYTNTPTFHCMWYPFDKMIGSWILKKQLRDFHAMLSLCWECKHIGDLSAIRLSFPNSCICWLQIVSGQAQLFLEPAWWLLKHTLILISFPGSHHLHYICGTTFTLSFQLKNLHRQIHILNEWPQLYIKSVSINGRKFHTSPSL